MDWKGKTVLVLGLGDTGLSCVRWLASRGAKLRAADTRPAPPALGAVRALLGRDAIALGPFAEALLEGVDAVVASPGLALREPIFAAARRRSLEILGDVEIFGREVARRGRARVIGITGTNGKSTVTALAGAMGRAAGMRTVVAGNIGLPVLDALADADGAGDPELYVLELSSYQLEMTSSLALAAGTVLNVTQDHLDRYESLAGYAEAKARIFRNCATRIVNRDDAWSFGMRGGERSFTFGLGEPRTDEEWGLNAGRTRLRRGAAELIAIDALGIKGLHNAANALAAHALMSAVGAPSQALERAMREFRGLPHRVERVAELKGIAFYDDSKATNVGAAVAALRGFTAPVVLIAGGEGKGQDFAPLAPAVHAHARAVVLIGRDAPAIAAALAGSGVPVEQAPTMEAAVAAAHAHAHAGDAVLLSPACASFDMFRNYGHRGDTFAAAARALAARRAH